jgi:ATP-binding cassette, subfamily B, bacterial MsbA
MKNFGRGVRLALRYRWNVVAVVLSAIAVAVFWGGNIGALYPIVEVAFQGRTLQQWVHDEIDKATEKSNVLAEEIAQLETAIQDAADPQALPLQNRLDVLRSRWQAEQTALSWAEWLKPAIHRCFPDDPFQTIVLIVLVLLVATAAKNGFIFSNLLLLERLVQLVSFDIRKELYHHTLRMDLSEFGEQRVGPLMSRFNMDLQCLSTGLRCLFGKALLEPFKALACLAGAAFISWRLLLFTLLLAPLAALLIRVLARSIKRANRRAMEENAQLMTVLSEAFQGMQTVKAFTMEKHERRRFHLVSKKCLRKAMRIALYNALTKPATEILGLAMVFTALIAGAYLVLNQETHILGIRMTERPISVAALLCFFGLLAGASDPARRLSELLNGLQAGVAAADRLFPLLDRQPQIADPAHPQPLPGSFARLSFQHVHFHYSPDQPVLQDLDFEVKAGETLCIVGPNGCGKSTLAGLLPRFYDPVRGAITVDGTDLRQLRLRDLRRFVGLVPQTALLFDDTVFNNIRYGAWNATPEQVVEAAQRAHAHRFILDALEHGYETNVGPGGGKLSGGQRQRIALARVILRDPQLLILDEATSQIDIESEQLIHRALEQFLRNRTAIIITHRLTTLELADRILVMQAGRVADLGNHQELMNRCELYMRLHDFQLRQSA